VLRRPRRENPAPANGVVVSGTRLSGARGVRDQRGDDAGGDACFGGVGAAGEDDRHARAEDDAGAERVGQVFELLGEHVAGFEVGHDEDVGASGDGRD
jgi:hypothetical protein